MQKAYGVRLVRKYGESPDGTWRNYSFLRLDSKGEPFGKVLGIGWNGTRLSRGGYDALDLESSGVDLKLVAEMIDFHEIIGDDDYQLEERWEVPGPVQERRPDVTVPVVRQKDLDETRMRTMLDAMRKGVRREDALLRAIGTGNRRILLDLRQRASERGLIRKAWNHRMAPWEVVL